MSRSATKLSMQRWLRKATLWPGQVKRFRRPRQIARRRGAGNPGLSTRFQQVARIRPRRLGPASRGLQLAAARAAQTWLAQAD